ncbi:GNAT family N-acetyltransferase [Haloarchaeobius amylolyticus]|uniref:GNAT family N-acetyltransferase n=1 Tax=Haloarchaeobius amylolyticus TaxID=1198296 RepID=UPI0022722516|nr:GNAT family N-acetyltransferase [Haloarchaeobius amylolyticus]
MRVREARPEEREAVEAVLDAAMLRTDAVPAAIDRGDALVAVADDRVLGAAVLDPKPGGPHLDAIAVRRRRRGQGIGSALVAAANARKGRLTAAFDPDVRPFYEDLGFEIRERDGRLWGVLD